MYIYGLKFIRVRTDDIRTERVNEERNPKLTSMQQIYQLLVKDQTTGCAIAYNYFNSTVGTARLNSVTDSLTYSNKHRVTYILDG